MHTEFQTISGYQRKHLRALAHPLKPVVLIGQRGATREVMTAIDEALDRHELIKIKFIENKSRTDKRQVLALLQNGLDFHLVGTIGHMAILFRQHPDREKQQIALPRRPGTPKEVQE